MRYQCFPSLVTSILVRIIFRDAFSSARILTLCMSRISFIALDALLHIEFGRVTGKLRRVHLSNLHNKQETVQYPLDIRILLSEAHFQPVLANFEISFCTQESSYSKTVKCVATTMKLTTLSVQIYTC